MPLLVAPALPAGSLRAVGQPTITAGERLALRPWLPGDVEVVRAAFGWPDIQRWHLRRMDSDDEARDWIGGWATRWAGETDASWAVVDRREERVVGQVGLRTVMLAEGSAQLSYWVLPAARRAGVAAAAVGALTGWAFGTLGLHRLFLMHSTANVPSCRVAGATGFALEGTLRGELRHTDGWHDVHVHGRLRTDPDRESGGGTWPSGYTSSGADGQSAA